MTIGIYLLTFQRTYYNKPLHAYYIGQSKNIEQRFNQHCKSWQEGNHTELMQKAYRDNNEKFPNRKILCTCHEDWLNPLERLYAQAYRNIYHAQNNVYFIELNTVILTTKIPNIPLDSKPSKYLKNLIRVLPIETGILESTFSSVLNPGPNIENHKLSLSKATKEDLFLKPLKNVFDIY